MSRATTQVFLHIGSPKTGTTYLQDALWRSRDDLPAQGLALAMGSLRDHFWLTLAAREELDPQIDPPAALNVLERFEQDLARAEAPKVLVSHELFSPATDEQAQRFVGRLGDYEVHVVITARDLARQIPAEWQEHVKHRSTKTFEEFIDGVISRQHTHFWTVQDAAGLAARWSAGLPPDRVHVVTVPPPGGRPEILTTRFCAVLGIDPAGLSEEDTSLNPSLGLEEVELLRRVNTALGDRLPVPRAGYGRVAKYHFAHQVLSSFPGRRLSLPAKYADWCAAAAEETISQLRDSGYDIVGDLEDLRPAPPPPDPEPFTVTDARIAEIGVDSVAALLLQRLEDLRALDAAQGRVRELERQSERGQAELRKQLDAERERVRRQQRRIGQLKAELAERSVANRLRRLRDRHRVLRPAAGVVRVARRMATRAGRL